MNVRGGARGLHAQQWGGDAVVDSGGDSNESDYAGTWKGDTHVDVMEIFKLGGSKTVLTATKQSYEI